MPILNVFLKISKLLKNQAVLVTLMWPSILKSEVLRTFTIGTVHDPRSILPLFQQFGEENVLRQYLMPPILSVLQDGKITCYLCKEAPSFDLVRDEKKNENELVVTLILRKKLEWGDGKELTRADVKFTLETMAFAPYPKGKRPILPIKRIEFDKDQDNKLRLILRHRRPDSAQLFSISLLPKHKEAKIKELLANTIDPRGHLAALSDSGFYYGPYKTKSVTPEELLLVQNSKNEWNGSPKDDIKVRFFRSLQELALSMSTHGIDQTLNNDLGWDEFIDLKSFYPDLQTAYHTEFSPGKTQEVLLLNMRSPLLINPQLRQALFYSIDRETIMKKYYDNSGLAAEGLTHPEMMQKLNEKRVQAYNPKLASHLAEQAGWHIKGDGLLHGDGQQKLSLTLSCTEGRLKTPWHQQIQADLHRLGIELKIDLLPEGEFQRQTLAHRRFKDLACMRWTIPPLATPIQLLHGLAIPSHDNDFIGQNYSGWDQPIVNRILENIMREHDLVHFMRLMLRLEKQFLSDIPAIPIIYLPRLTLTRKVETDSSTKEIQKRLAIYHEGVKHKL